MLVRNLFDQYRHPENRLTHALFQVFKYDTQFLREFVRWVLGPNEKKLEHPEIACQTRPGQLVPETIEDDEKKPRARSIPDGWIYEISAGLALVVENKVTDAITDDQLMRHKEVARKLGFEHIQILAITADRSAPQAIAASIQNGAIWRSWSDFYVWANSKVQPHSLAGELLRFLEIMENELQQKGKIDMTLTGFTGIPFSKTYSYNPIEARSVLSGIMVKLAEDNAIKTAFPYIKGHSRINVGTEGAWSTLKLRDPFYTAPHITIEINRDSVRVYVVLPSGAETHVWKRLPKSMEELSAILSGILNTSSSTLKGMPKFYARLSQSHHPQRHVEIEDAFTEVDLDTYLDGKIDQLVKTRKDWFYNLMNLTNNKHGTKLQLNIGFNYRFSSDAAISIIRVPDFINEAARACIALGPWLDLLTGSPEANPVAVPTAGEKNG